MNFKWLSINLTKRFLNWSDIFSVKGRGYIKNYFFKKKTCQSTFQCKNFAIYILRWNRSKLEQRLNCGLIIQTANCIICKIWDETFKVDKDSSECCFVINWSCKFVIARIYFNDKQWYGVSTFGVKRESDILLCWKLK